jgi:hypothetical protein
MGLTVFIVDRFLPAPFAATRCGIFSTWCVVLCLWPLCCLTCSQTTAYMLMLVFMTYNIGTSIVHLLPFVLCSTLFRIFMIQAYV